MNAIYRIPELVSSYFYPSTVMSKLYKYTPSWKRIEEMAPTLLPPIKEAAYIYSAYLCCKSLPTWFFTAFVIGAVADEKVPPAIKKIINIWSAFPIQTSLLAYYFLPATLKTGTSLFGAHIGAKISKHVQEQISGNPAIPPAEDGGLISNYLNIRTSVVRYLSSFTVLNSLYQHIPSWQGIKKLAPTLFSYSTHASYIAGALLCAKEWPYLFWCSCIAGGMADHNLASRTAEKITNIWKAYNVEIILSAFQFLHMPRVKLAPITYIPWQGYQFSFNVPNIQFSPRTVLIGTALFGAHIGAEVSKYVQERIQN